MTVSPETNTTNLAVAEAYNEHKHVTLYSRHAYVDAGAMPVLVDYFGESAGWDNKLETHLAASIPAESKEMVEGQPRRTTEFVIIDKTGNYGGYYRFSNSKAIGYRLTRSEAGWEVKERDEGRKREFAPRIPAEGIVFMRRTFGGDEPALIPSERERATGPVKAFVDQISRVASEYDDKPKEERIPAQHRRRVGAWFLRAIGSRSHAS